MKKLLTALAITLALGSAAANAAPLVGAPMLHEPQQQQAQQKSFSDYKQLNTQRALGNINYLERNLGYLDRNPEVSDQQKQVIQRSLVQLKELKESLSK